METIYILFVLIVALARLIYLNKEVSKYKEEDQECDEDYSYTEQIEDKNYIQENEIKDLKKSNKAYKGANTKYKEKLKHYRKSIETLKANCDYFYFENKDLGKASEEQIVLINKND